jgi:hypothetical protein
MSAIEFTDADIDIEVRGADDPPLIRLFRHTGAAYGLPAEAHRNGRFDPPPGDKGLFATLYTADNIAAAAMECRILQANSRDEYSYTLKRAASYKVVRFKYQEPALFIRVDRDVKRKLGIPPFTIDYSPFQRAAKALFERYGNTVHGLSWESFHRGQPGRNYGFWHHRKDAITLEPLQQEAECPQLLNDADWIQLLRDYPVIELQPDEDPPPDATPAPTPAPAAAAPKTTW